MEDTLQNHKELKAYWEKNRKNYDTQLKSEKKSFQTFFDEKV